MRHPLRTNGLRLLAALLLALAVGCEQAQRYGTDQVEPKTKPEPKTLPVPAHYGWRESTPVWDRPIRFVTADSKERKLYDFWNELTPDRGRPPLLLIGQPPLQAVAALGLAWDADVVRILVPLGLPDPTPYIPASNPPTLAKWRLGQKLFFDEKLLPTGPLTGMSCVACHHPEQGFTLCGPPPNNVRYNPLSLFNVVYNKQQFWNGRVETLEQVIQRRLTDEDAPVKAEYDRVQSPEYRHSWGGVIGRLRGRKKYDKDFEDAFGEKDATIDNVGKALATYLRTLLSGNSLYDRAEKARQEDKDQPKELLAKHFSGQLYHDQLKRLGREDSKIEEVAKELELGRRLFLKSGCNRCHQGPLFTDQGYHNIGIGDSFRKVKPIEGAETGRFAVLPYGQKERRAIGAYRTPTLRNLPRTHPYMHVLASDLTMNLKVVLDYYNTLIDGNNLYLDPLLRAGPESAQHLNLTEAELNALELFLRSLDGKEVPEQIRFKPR